MNARMNITLSVTVEDTIAKDFIKPFPLYLEVNGKVVGMCPDRYCCPIGHKKIKITFDIFQIYFEDVKKFEADVLFSGGEWKSEFVVMEELTQHYHNLLRIWKE